jgi:hypothetical protein
MSKMKDNSKDDFEDWHKPIYTEDPDHVPVKFQKPPKVFEQGFLQKLDGRTVAFQALNDSFNELTADLGGVKGLSHIQLCLVERFVFLEYFLKSLEAKIASSPKKSSRLIARWVQSLNCLIGLAKCVGLERRVKTVTNLKDYVLSKKSKK